MKISLNWLKRYLDIDMPAGEIGALLTGCGLEVEAVSSFESIRGGLRGVVTGRVLSCVRHPNADKLSLTRVDIGGETPLQIVCGAPNVAAGQKVLVATVGTVLYLKDQTLEIRPAKIRGELSEGMICAVDELGLGDSHEGILVMEDNTEIGRPASEYFPVYEDVVFEIGLTPNRADAFSHTGVARDLLAVLKTQFPAQYSEHTLRWPDVGDFQAGTDALQIPVVVEDITACPRYTSLIVSGVKVGDSPQWMKDLLTAAGMRPINNIVDITNFVMLETGQPLHPFDADRIAGGKVIVRKLPAGTGFITLDGVRRTLSGEDLMICNEKEGMCIAGVYGGLEAGISETTTRVFLESAYFHPVSVRKTSKTHGLKTDSSQRYERGGNPDITVYAAKRAALLMEELAGGKISSTLRDHYPDPVPNRLVTVRFDKLDKLIGKRIERDILKNILGYLGIRTEQETEDGLRVSVPPFKVDVYREADIAEEILRIYGYNNIPLSDGIRYAMVHSGGRFLEKMRNHMAGLLSAHGFHEIWCNSLTRSDYTALSPDFPAESYVRLLNPLSRDLEVMRRTLLFGALETMVHNLNRREQQFRFYEFGNIYAKRQGMPGEKPLEKYHEEEHLAILVSGDKFEETWYTPGEKVDFFFLKGLIHLLFSRAGIRGEQCSVRPCDLDSLQDGLQYYTKDGKVLLEAGLVAPHILKAFDIKLPVYYASVRWAVFMKLAEEHQVVYHEIPKFPWVRRDLALLVDRQVSFGDIERLALETEKSLLKTVNLFDIYQGEGIGEGKKSYAVSFILQDDTKTLTDAEIDGVMNRLTDQFGRKLGATLR